MSSNPRIVDQEGFRTQLAVVLLAGVFASVVAIGAAAVAAFDRAVGPELSNRTRLIGLIVRAEVQRAAEAGIPLNAIAGLDRYLSETLEKFREVERIGVSTSSGQSVAVVERLGAAPILPRADRDEAVAGRQAAFVLPVIDGNRLVGEIRVDISPRAATTGGAACSGGTRPRSAAGCRSARRHSRIDRGSSTRSREPTVAATAAARGHVSSRAQAPARSRASAGSLSGACASGPEGAAAAARSPAARGCATRGANTTGAPRGGDGSAPRSHATRANRTTIAWAPAFP